MKKNLKMFQRIKILFKKKHKKDQIQKVIIEPKIVLHYRNIMKKKRI